MEKEEKVEKEEEDEKELEEVEKEEEGFRRSRRSQSSNQVLLGIYQRKINKHVHLKNLSYFLGCSSSTTTTWVGSWGH